METARSVACDRHESKRRSFAISGRTKSQRIVPRPEPGEREEGEGEIFQGRLENGRGNRLDIEPVPFLPDVKLTVSIKITIERVYIHVHVRIHARQASRLEW